jgi:hypothetical protein
MMDNEMISTFGMYLGVLISLRLFLFLVFLLAAQPKAVSLDGLKLLQFTVIKRDCNRRC